MANNSISVYPWQSTTTYGIYDVTQGLVTGGNLSSYGPMYWSTSAGNVGNNPSGQFVYAISNYSRGSDLATINLAFTGACPAFARGSLYAITGMPDPTFNATGMILNANSGAAGFLTLQFINPGLVVAQTSTSLGAVNAPQPAWTTGFFWSPTYQSQWDTSQAVIRAQFEPTYEQRQPQGIINNNATWTLQFDNRTDAEVKGIAAFIQNLQGTYSTPILIPPTTLSNTPTTKYVLTGPKVTPVAYNQSNVTVGARQVYDF